MGVDAFEVYAKIKADTSDFEDKLSGVKGKLGKLGSMLGNAAKTTAKVVGATAAASGAAVVKIAKDAVASYGEYEQLVGGIKLSLGNAYDFVAEKAKTAYKDVQMSQNDYMRQVNQFSVALRESLEGDQRAAAELADKMIKAQADLVAATGNSAEMIENAFVGVMRGNYVMLDNLGLGIKPTKEGMQEVIDKVNEWNKAQGKATKYTIDNIADTEAALVDYVHMMNMSGYASAEASDTIQGSMAGAKAAYQDLLTALANPKANVKQSFDNLFNMLFGGVQDGKEVKGVLGNMMPIFGQALTSIGELVQTRLPMLLNKIPKFLEENLPVLLKAVGNILNSIGEFLRTQLPALIDKAKTWIGNNWTKIRDAVKDILYKVIDWAAKELPGMAGDIGEAIGTFLGDAAAIVIPKLPEILGTLFDAALSFFTGIFDALDEKIPGLGYLLEGLTAIILVGVAAWKGYQAGLAISNAIEMVKVGIVKLTAAVEGSTVAQNLLNAAQAAAPYLLIIAGITAIILIIKELWENCDGFREFWTDAWEGLKKVVSDAWEAIKGWAEDLWANIKDAWEGLKQLASDVCEAIGGFFSDVWNGMVSAIEWVIEKVKALIGWIKEAIEAMNPLNQGSFSDITGKVNSYIEQNSQPTKGGGSSGGSSAGMPSNIPVSVNNSSRNSAESALDEVSGGITSSSTVYTPTSGGLGTSGTSQGPNNSKIVIPVYIGQERIEEIVVDANNRNNYRTGGR